MLRVTSLSPETMPWALSRLAASIRCAPLLTRAPWPWLSSAPGDAQGHVAFAGDDALGVIQAGGVDPLRALADQRALAVVVQRGA